MGRLPTSDPTGKGSEAPANAARALRTAEERYRLAARATDDIVWDYDLERQVIHWNEALIRRFGHEAADLVTSVDWWEAHLHPDDRARTTASLEGAIDGSGESWSEEYRFRRADGGYADVLDRGYVIRDEQGRAIRMVGAILDLSDRKAMEQALRENEQRLRLAQEAARIGSFEWDLTTGEGRGSPKAFDIFGLPRTERINVPGLFGVIHPEDRARVAAYLDRAISGEVEGSIEHRIIRPSDGQMRWVRISGRRIGDDPATSTRRAGIVEDITNRKLADTALRQSEERLRLAQEVAGLGMFDWDLVTDEPAFSETYSRLFGLGDDEPVNIERLIGLVHPDDRSAVQNEVTRTFVDGGSSELQFRIHRASDQQMRWMRMTSRTYRDAADQPVRRIGVVEDITDRKLAEERLRESEENYRFTVELSPQLAWTADGDGSNIEFKRPWTEFAEPPPEEAHDWTDWIAHPDDIAFRRREWEFSLRSGRPFDVEFRVRNRDGEYRWIRSRGYPRRDETGRIVKWYGVTEDIHARRAAEQQLQRLQDELSQVARVSAMGTLASTLAHELNQPLTAVANYMAGSKRLLMNHGAAAASVIAEALENASKAAIQAGEIVRRLRDLVSRGEVHTQRVDLANLIHEACELTLGDPRERLIELSLEFGPNTRWVLADRIQVQQVLVNLLRNASEAMADSPRRIVTLSATASGDEQVTIRVEDSGPGVSPDVKRHLFSPFVTTKESGMGVGLSICRSIVEAHGGQLWVEDAPGGGAAFCFTLNRAN